MDRFDNLEVKLTITFESKPDMPLKALCENLSKSQIFFAPPFEYQTEEGSYLEIFSGASTFLASIYVVFKMINCNLSAATAFLDGIIKLKNKYNELTHGGKKESYPVPISHPATDLVLSGDSIHAITMKATDISHPSLADDFSRKVTGVSIDSYILDSK